MIKACENCGKKFTGRGNSKYCSRECALQARPLKKKICAKCGAEFETKYAGQKYCSSKCADAAYKARHNRTVFTKTKRNCAICGKEFETKYVVQKYCSAECQKQGHDEATRRYIAAHPRPPKRLAPVCPICGKGFTRKNLAQKYCSECTEAIEKSRRRKCLKCGAELPGEGLYCASCREKIKLSREDHFEKMTREASECGMSYGEYKTAIRQGKSYDELKAAAAEKRHSTKETLKNSFLGHLFRD